MQGRRQGNKYLTFPLLSLLISCQCCSLKEIKSGSHRIMMWTMQVNILERRMKSRVKIEKNRR
jgi:hypothetical protein